MNATETTVNTAAPLHVKPAEAFHDEMFTKVVGQEKVKSRLLFLLDGYLHSHFMPPLGIIAPSGQGKTFTARETAKGLFEFDDNNKVVMRESKKHPGTWLPKPKEYHEVNCASIHNLEGFLHGVVYRLIQDKTCTIFFDEMSEIPRDVTMALLSILEPNPLHRTTYTIPSTGQVAEFDFTRQSLIFATAEPHKVDKMLLNRFERISLQEYTPDNIAEIIQRNTPDVKYSDGLLADMATTMRGSARDSYLHAERIYTYLKGGKMFTWADWARFKRVLGILPLGLNDLETAVLRYIEAAPAGISLTSLSAKTGMTREALRLDIEMYLLKHGLIEITTTGRVLSQKGHDYMKQLRAAELAAKQPTV